MDRIIEYIPRMWKAIYAGVAAGSFTYGGLQTDGMTWPEWGYLVVAIAVAVLGTWKVSNAPAERRSPGPTEPGTVGSTDPSGPVEGPRAV